MDFFITIPGQYMVQTVLHSAAIVIVVEVLIHLWHIRQPSLQIKLRFLALILPVLYLPFYFLLYPARASTVFRQQVALIDINAWLGLRLGMGVVVWHLFAAILVLTTAYFRLREAAPIMRHYLRRRHSFPTVEKGQFPKLDSVLGSLTGAHWRPAPLILLSSRDTPVIYTLGRRALVVSATTIDLLDNDELEAVIAHELAHLSGPAYFLSQASLVLRFLMFYNPVALFAFRRIISDSEKNCDDAAAAATGKPLALASGLLKVSQKSAAVPVRTGGRRRRFPSLISALEHWAYGDLFQQRVDRLVHSNHASEVLLPRLRLLVTAALLVALLFFVV